MAASGVLPLESQRLLFSNRGWHPPPMDEWDRRTRGILIDSESDRPRLAELARRFLEERRDQALGLAPARLLPPRKARAWILFWTAARRVDDFEESGVRRVEEWRQSLVERRQVTLAERCLHAFLRRPEGAGTNEGLLRLLHRGLDGLMRERAFTEPRPFGDYLDLIHEKSATAMLILDRLLFAGEDDELLVRHAELFAASTQIGDDCRDALRDLARGRCFLTIEELPRGSSPKAYASTPPFARTRKAVCLRLLDASDSVAKEFRMEEHRSMARRLAAYWRYAIASDQVAPTRRRLVLPKPNEPAARTLRADAHVPEKVRRLLRARLQA